ncbi:hypothetical protein [Sphingomonas sp. CARO-RG-8B-R24-01]|uniref:hypothetical protein n=1 Tax=Sphingomonas sp. CARO-RG-8B-R24-01 TaxID=2914831 RepID=UPI001F575B57|nr:hypothetical protein [Sphingomonas sp. CARO-RG-8B-R24-01]
MSAPVFRTDLDYPPFAVAAIPAYDPESPDLAILAAFEEVRRNKVWTYQFDDYHQSLHPTVEEFAERDEMQLRREEFIHGNFATTVPGVVAQLLFMLTQADQDRWVDRDLAESGFRALLPHSKALDWSAQMTLNAVDSLVHLEWDRNLESYERNETVLGRALEIEDLIDKEAARQRPTGGVSQFVADLETAIERLIAANAKHSDGEDPAVKLMKTLAPDQAAYLRKLEIIVAEDLGGVAALWMARDVQHLIGMAKGPKSKGEA